MTDGVWHWGRPTFWAVNRDRSCPAGTTSGTTSGATCSGIVPADHPFTTLTAGSTG